MKKKHVKALISLAVVTAMLVGCGNTATQETEKAESSETIQEEKTEESKENADPQENEEAVASEYPEYLNLDDYRPIVKEGEKITLTVGVDRGEHSVSNIEDSWFAHFIEEKLNIDLEIIEVNDEKKSLMLTSGELPDMLLGVSLTNSEVVLYGDDGELLLPLNDYLNETLAPNLVQLLEELPYGKTICTLPSGNMYAVPATTGGDPTVAGCDASMSIARTFIDTTYMEAAGITEVPDTLDGFVEMLRTFKALDPASVGVDEIWPMVTSSRQTLWTRYFSTAFGWINNTSNFASPVWDVTTNQIEVPCMTDKYKEYVKLMNTLYSEGLIHPDFYTMDETTARAQFVEGIVPVLVDWAPYVACADTYENYVSAAPLKSEWNNDTQIAVRGTLASVAPIYISADTEYPELCVRFLDYLYSPEGSVYQNGGPMYGSEDDLGMGTGFQARVNESGKTEIYYPEQESDADAYEYNINANRLFYADLYTELRDPVQHEMLGIEYDRSLDLTNPDHHYRSLVFNATNEFLTDGLPETYMSVEDTARFSDLKTVINDYVLQETAKFVVGQRPLDELDAFMQEVQELGAEEYLELCRNAYATYER